MPNSPEATVDAIRTAFAGVPRGLITIHEAEVIDSYGALAERQAARLLDTEVTWEDVPGNDLVECTTALCHLDPEGWRYYLPAYMIWVLRNLRISDSIIVDSTIYALDPCNGNPDLRDYKMERFRLLDTAQAQAVCQFLRFMADEEAFADALNAKKALDDFWGEHVG